ncbi:MAG: hypothetical protein DHS20C11_10100 [Lysobacteraceae bacterium]|nr:MAG: hypothetical protein DHS20C11_10100 [Xanthomonadaceae bacterium]
MIEQLYIANAIAVHLGYLLAPPGIPGHLSVQSATGTYRADRQRLDLTIDLDFARQVKRALERGVPVTLTWEARLQNADQWWWQADLRHAEGEVVVRFHSLSKHWLVASTHGNEELSFASRRALMSALSRWHGLDLGTDDWTQLESNAKAAVRVELDISALPAPLRLPAWINHQWRMDTGWVPIALQADRAEAS